VAADGVVRVGSDVVAQLRVAQVAAETPLTPLGGDLFRAALLPEADSAARVRQGFLETSNVESVQEMVRLIETMRHFESVQHFVRGYDDMMGKAISELGKV
jgi:flagellar basal body rod protein FlgG